MGVWVWPQNPSQHSDPGSLESASAMKPTYTLSLFWPQALFSQIQKLSLRRNQWSGQGHTTRPWESWGSCEPTNVPHFTSAERRHNQPKIFQGHRKNSNFTVTMRRQAYTSSGTQRGSSYHPTREKTGGFWGQRKQRSKSRVKGGGGGDCIWQWRSF